MTEITPERAALSLARAECRESLARSIHKRTDMPPREAMETARLRCGLLFDGGAVAADTPVPGEKA